MSGEDFGAPPRAVGSQNATSNRHWNLQLSPEPAKFAKGIFDVALRAAWSIILARYCETLDVSFGASSYDRELTDLVPMEVTAVTLHLDPEQQVGDFLHYVKNAAQRPSSNDVLQELQANCEPPSRARQEANSFSTLLIVHKGSSLIETFTAPKSHSRVTLSYEQFTVELYADPQLCLLTDDRVTVLPYHFDRILQQLISGIWVNSRLYEVPLAGEWDLKRAMAMNGNTPETIRDCIHALITRMAERQPNAEAICAWDGTFTYAELDAAASRLARHLTGKVTPESYIPICFEKSAWVFVAIIAINKSGGAWVPFDPLHPPQRLRELVHQAKAKLALTSPANVSLCKSLGLSVVEVTTHLDRTLAHDETTAGFSPSLLPQVDPANAAYCLFTSGSTGVPKGLIIEHGSLCTSQISLGKHLGLTRETRFLQFASYVFDSCIAEIFATLLVGGCVCVPSDDSRWTEIPAFIRHMRVNTALLTPSFIRTMKPADVPTLKLLITASEAAGQDMLDTWLNKVRLVNAWGPAEICCIATLYEWRSASESPLIVGTPVNGSRSWIVDSEDHSRLAPMCCVGEIVVQGPTILREYLSNPEKTRQSIISPTPPWMQHATPARGFHRFFKTGDLGFYDSTGRIHFVGRKDTQVKIRGQRVELGDVELKILRQLKPHNICQVAVDVLQSEVATSLVAYICFSWETKRASENRRDNMLDLFLDMTKDMSMMLSHLLTELKSKLPNYMVPGIYIPIRYMPYTTKLDRKTLKRKTKALSKSDILKYSLLDSDWQVPETASELQMQQLWASILKVPANTIGSNDNFLQIGGDSISAIRLISLARERHGLVLRMESILKDARLRQLAATAGSVADIDAALPPFALLPNASTNEIVNQTLRQCELSSQSDLDDLYPCTPLQEGLFALGVAEHGSYLTTWLYKLSSHIDLVRFKIAWERTIARCDGLRTRIVQTDHGIFQAVLKDDVEWDASLHAEDESAISVLERTKEQSRKTHISTGTRLWRYALTRFDDGESYFTLIGHHAVFDGLSINIVMQQLQSLYEGTSPPILQPFSRFIQYLQGLDREASERYWTAQLKDVSRTAFPLRKPGRPETNGNSVIRTMMRSIALPSLASSITKASLLRAAWAIVLGRYCDTDDVCFAASISGRHAPVPDLERECGPVVTTVPVRLSLNAKQSAMDFLHNVQSHASDMIPHEHFGLQSISKISQAASEACQFPHVLVIHPIEILDGLHDTNPMMNLISEHGMESASSEYFGYPLVLQAFIRDADVRVSATYNVAWMTEADVVALHNHIERVVEQLVTPGERLLGDISLAGSWDLQQASLHNKNGPEAINDCYHYLIQKMAQDCPDSPAISAWDGELTYAQFETMADRLARYLVIDMGLAVGDLVHVCFEKSLWFYVAVLAISKAGGAFVPLDPSHPIDRQQELIRQTGSRLTLTSKTNAKRCAGKTVLEITKNFDKVLAHEQDRRAHAMLPTLTGQDAAYVLFTSGSTGVPKGLVMEHGSVCTSMAAAADRLHFTSDMRMLQFASYAFDVFVFESICIFLSGGCICVPSEADRLTGLEDFIRQQTISWAVMTPTFARTIDSARVPDLKGLVIGGESAGQDLIRAWLGNGTRLINAYGPAEACVISTLHEFTSLSDSPQTIGRPVGGHCWIVEPDDHTRLAPIGCIGEIVVQGPIVLREYLADREKTQAAIKTAPIWMHRRMEAKYNRLYRTGDLAYYNPDGTIEFIGRKDLQLKIRGQRVESGEVEHHIKMASGDITKVAVDVLRSNEAQTAYLVAYLCFSPKTGPVDGPTDSTKTQRDGPDCHDRTDEVEPLFVPLTNDIKSQLRIVADTLQKKVPAFMVPTLWVPCRYMPYITTTKLDRKRLRLETENLGAEDRAQYSLAENEKQEPRTAEESKLRDMWASILKVPIQTIGRDDTFLQMGGDSLGAIHLVLLARRQGVTLTVSQIMQDDRLSSMAATIFQTSSSVL